jgi:hypothetical protein
VGAHGDDAQTTVLTLVEHWNGNSWTIVDSPSESSAPASILNGITCPSASNCRAVGLYINASSIAQTLIIQWDGSSWSVVPSPDQTTQANSLSGVACASANDCWAVGSYNNSSVNQTLIERDVAPAQLSAVVSRKTHGNAGTFDVNLPLDGSGIECRDGGSGGNYELVFTFSNPLTNVDSASVTTGTGSAGSSNIDPNDAHNYVVDLTGVVNAQRITVSLTNVADSAGDFSASVPITMGVLVGDVNASRRVDAADVSSVRQQTLQTIDVTNFRNDVNVSGRIDAADVSVVRQQTLTSLP